MAGENQSRKRHRRMQRPTAQSPGKEHSRRERFLFGHTRRVSSARSPTGRTGKSTTRKDSLGRPQTTGDFGDGDRLELVAAVLPKTPVAPILSPWSSSGLRLGDRGLRWTSGNAVATSRVDRHAATTTETHGRLRTRTIPAPITSPLPTYPSSLRSHESQTLRPNHAYPMSNGEVTEA
jgi:hypothetical protein